MEIHSWRILSLIPIAVGLIAIDVHVQGDTGFSTGNSVGVDVNQGWYRW